MHATTKSRSALARAMAALLLLCLVFPLGSVAVKAQIQEDESRLITEMLEKTMASSKIPCVSAVALRGEEETTFFINRNGWNGEDGIQADTLFEIGSLSKAFTGFAVLLLEGRGQLSLEDPITQHIGWLNLIWEGEEAAHTITVGDLLYQTSGFTNNDAQYPPAQPGMTLEENVRQLTGRALAFAPGSRYNYANANYNLLGYIIEEVTGAPYATFLQEEVFLPLGLTNTWADPQEGLATGLLVPGSRVGFRNALPYGEDPLLGDVPAGFILSCERDMAQWARVQLGLISLPDEYTTVVEKSHQPGAQLSATSPLAYAAGWFVNEETGIIYHAGGTNAYSAHIILNPNDLTAACALANMNASANTTDMAVNILNAMNGHTDMAYSSDIWTVMDIIFTTMLYVSAMLVLLLAFLFLRGMGRQGKPKSKAWLALPGLLLVLLLVALFVFPAAFHSSWASIFEWGPPSILWGLIAYCIFTALLAVGTIRRTCKPKG